MIKEEFSGDYEQLNKYNNDTLNNINKYIKELTENNYLTITIKTIDNEVKYDYIIYHNRWKMI